MKTRPLGNTSLAVSEIGLGTVEIGIPYGLENRLPTNAEAERILKHAVENGVTYIDTARGYGVAEERIGASGITKKAGVVIGTKCAQFLEQDDDPRGSELEQRIRTDVEASLRALRADSLQLVQLHGGSKEQIERGELVEIMQKLVDEGLVQHVGIAIRSEDAALAAIASGFFATVQAAYSILDQRMSPRVFPTALEAGMGIINRSVLLKGALTPRGQELPDELAPLKQNAQQAATTAEALGVPLPELALRFVLGHEAVSVALVGTADPAHIDAALAAASAGPLPSDAMHQLTALAIDDIAQVDPSHWPKP